MMDTKKVVRDASTTAIGAILLFFGSPALACPICSSNTGKAVRAEVFGSDFAYNFLVTLLPFLLFAVIVAAIYYGIPNPIPTRKSNE